VGADQSLRSDQETKHTVGIAENLSATFCDEGIQKLVQRYKCLNLHGCYTRWFKYDCVNKSQFVPVIFEQPCILM
jgi:hypothetical protein